MSSLTRSRTLLIVAGGAVAVLLALLLLPKPSTGPLPVVPDSPEPTVGVAPTPPAPAAPRQAAAPVPPPPAQVEAVPLSSVPPTRDAVLPVSSRGFRDAMRLRYDEMVGCYDAWAGTQEGIEGDQVIRFYIEPGEEQSLLDRVEVMDSSFDNSTMEECVHGVLADAAFEPSDALTIYTFPFSFEGRDGK